MAGVGCLDQPRDLGLAQEDRNGLIAPGRHRHHRRVVVDEIFSTQVFHKTLQRRQFSCDRRTGLAGGIQVCHMASRRLHVEIRAFQPGHLLAGLGGEPRQVLRDIALVRANGMRRDVPIVLEKREKLLMGMPTFTLGEHIPTLHIECGEERRGAMAGVAVGDAFDIAQGQR